MTDTPVISRSSLMMSVVISMMFEKYNNTLEATHVYFSLRLAGYAPKEQEK
jgi:hypothetical protein